MSDAGASGSPRAVRALAPAKVNPVLEVVGRRADGYHELDTLMVALDLADELRVERRGTPGVELRLDGPALTEDVPSDGRNLAVRAAELVLEDALREGRVARGTGVLLHLTKNVPSQAGLGGGSSDAAAALAATARLLAHEWEADRVHAALASLGSDCAFFHDAATTGFARCKGRGDDVHVLDPIDPAWCFALFAPDLSVPTASVFEAVDRGLSEGFVLPSVPERLFSCTESEARLGLFNRLEAAASSSVPELTAWRSLLDQNGAQHFLLSGSGSTYFGLYRNSREARASLASLARAAGEQGLGLRGTWVARPLGRGTKLLPDGGAL